MDTYIRFLFEFMSVFFKGIASIFGGIFKGFIQMFNIQEYMYVIDFYKKDFNGGEWVLVILAILVMVIILGLIVAVFVFIIKKIFKFRKTLVDQESMLKEIGELNKKVADLVQEKEKIVTNADPSALHIKKKQFNLNSITDSLIPTLNIADAKYSE